MPTFETPEPIAVTVELPAGELRLIATDRADTTVEVRPSRANSTSGQRAAEQTTIEFADGKLLVKTPKGLGMFGTGGIVDVLIELPTGSGVRGTASSADITTTGRLGDMHIHNSSGDVRLDATGALELDATSGNIRVDKVDGDARITVSSGDVRIREIGGALTLKSSSGNSWLGTVAGELQVSVANGDITVALAEAGVNARTVSGDVRIAEVVRGSVNLEAASGDLEVGIRPGVAAWLDVSSNAGTVRNEMETVDKPDDAADTVEVRARSGSGDVLVRHSEPATQNA